MGEGKLTARDIEVLNELVGAYDQIERAVGWHPKMSGDGVWDGVAPLDCGGSNGSDHSYRLTKLCKLGLAEARKGASEWGQFSTRYKGSKKYRPTAAGRAALSKALGTEDSHVG
jgi:hypothetical protein